jgi:hypothetical protein
MGARIIKPSEKTIDKDGRTIRPGDILTHPRYGLTQLDRVDRTTFSIDMVVVKLIKDGEYTGITVLRSASEFTKKG